MELTSRVQFDPQIKLNTLEDKFNNSNRPYIILYVFWKFHLIFGH